ncbi:hypothetical protein [Burkholderia phage BCSR5]|nr:hypothetical protein [Burkholderia phage BCSR5]
MTKIVQVENLDFQNLLNTEDLYEVLGLTKDATVKQIKAAYRKLSMKFHPDRNGSSEESIKAFQKIQHAYAILSKREKRDFYDLVGGEYPTEDQLKQKAQSLWAKVLTEVMDQAAQRDQLVIAMYNPVSDARGMLQQNKRQMENQRKKMAHMVERYQSMMKRMKHAKGEFKDTLSGQVIQETIDEHRKRYLLLGLDIELHELAAKLIDDYTCEVEMPKDVDAAFNVVFGGGNGFRFG